MKSRGVWRRVARVYACALGLLLSVGCGESGESSEERLAAPDPAPSGPVDAGPGTNARDGGNVIVETPPDSGPDVDGGTSSGADAGSPGDGQPDAGGTDGGDGKPPERGDGGSGAGTPDGDDGGTSTPDAGGPPVTGGPVQRGKQWRASYYAGVSPGGLAVGDFNGDGAPDVAVNNLGASLQSRYKARPGSFAVLLNDGKGVLRKPSSRLKLNTSSGRIAVGHAEASGPLGVVLGGRYGATLLSGQGNGTFDTLPTYFSQGLISGLGFLPGTGRFSPRVWAVGDGDDSRQGPRTEGGFRFLLNWDGGEFQERGVYRVEDGLPVVNVGDVSTAAAVADFNEDGHIDVVLASGHWFLTRFMGTGTDRFEPWPYLERRPDFIASADVNGDGHADLVAVDGRELWTSPGRGNGDFAERLVTFLPIEVSRLVVADVDADSVPDVVLLHGEQGQASIWRGNGQGRFEAPRWLATGRKPSDAAVADLDRDGTPELLVTEAEDNVVSVYSIPRHAFTEAPFTPRCPMGLLDAMAEWDAPEPLLSLEVGVGAEVVTTGDFDGNGRRDLALPMTERGVRLLMGQEDGALQAHDALMDWRVEHLAAGDFNEDGRADLAVIAGAYPGGGSTLQLRWSDGSGQFLEGRELSYVYAQNGGYLIAGDFNRDGRMDVAGTFWTPCTMAAAVMTNQGGGIMWQSPLPDQNSEPDDRCGGASGLPTPGDFNGDGTLDFVHVTLGVNLNYTSKAGTVMQGEGYYLGYPRDTVRSAGDVDGDGNVDLLLSGGGTLRVLRGDGGGTLESPLSCPMKATGGALLEAVDVNGDGIMDLLGRDADGAVLVVPGKGGGDYLPVRRYPLEAKPLWAAPVDLRGDAKPELVVLLESGTLKVFPTPAP
ncbi:FG-GAP repeat domain-containing protein [Pyxidicoccus trucidator]|uniref:FG-GAP repeat domain-containing protein n=1 Tax=Pyxidicoccus trucidator TaxID=2709662 RepID=UPI0013DB557C|nr:VCBS repeat-containing protein [Pyxidicoccus trucidator]